MFIYLFIDKESYVHYSQIGVILRAESAVYQTKRTRMI